MGTVTDITVYTQKGCQPCRLTAKQLDLRNIPYTAVDITEDGDGLASVRDLGYSSVPVVVAGERHWSGYRPDDIDGLATYYKEG